MSMQFPLARDSDAAGNQYAVWQSNEPMWPAAPQVCHGLPSKDVPSGMSSILLYILHVYLSSHVPGLLVIF